MFYDGTCGLCQRSIQWLVARDPEGQLHYAPLGGETAARLGHPALSVGGDAAGSLVFVYGGRAMERSEAIFALLGIVRSGWRWLRVFRFLPRWLTNLPYRLIARVRYRLFGRVDACALPSPALATRLLP